MGFIRKLPPHLIASFKSTLKEVKEADIILHIIDFSNPYYEDHIQVVEDTLKELNCEKKTLLKIFNKIDLVNDRGKINLVRNKYDSAIIISAQRGINITALKDKLTDLAEETFVEEDIDLEITNSKAAAAIHSLAEVLNKKYDENSVHITYRTNKENSEKIKKMFSKA